MPLEPATTVVDHGIGCRQTSWCPPAVAGQIVVHTVRTGKSKYVLVCVCFESPTLVRTAVLLLILTVVGTLWYGAGQNNRLNAGDNGTIHV